MKGPAVVGFDGIAIVLVALLIGGLVQLVLLVREVDTRRAEWREGERRLAWRPVWMTDVGVVLVAVLAGSLLALKWIPRPEDDSPALPPEALLAQFVCFQLVIVAVTGLLLRRRRLRWRDAFSDPTQSVVHAAGYAFRQWLALFPLMILVAILTQFVLRQLGIPPKLQGVLQTFHTLNDPLWLWLAVGFAVVGAPVSEEILFRGLLLPAMAKWIGVPNAVLLSSAAFAAIHFELQQAPALYVLSLALSLTYIYTRRLEAAVLLHGLFNGFMVFLSFRMPDGPPG